MSFPKVTAITALISHSFVTSETARAVRLFVMGFSNSSPKWLKLKKQKQKEKVFWFWEDHLHFVYVLHILIVGSTEPRVPLIPITALEAF